MEVQNLLETNFQADAAAGRQAVRSFRHAVASSDMVAFCDALTEVEQRWQWRAAFQAVAPLNPSIAFRKFFLDIYVDSGDSFRRSVDDDRALVHGLRALLPEYSGPDIRLWRGANKTERLHRLYGHAWTSDLTVARQHAAKPVHQGIGVVFETDAPQASIISAPHLETTSFHESEYVVDRSKLGKVRIIEHLQSSSA